MEPLRSSLSLRSMATFRPFASRLAAPILRPNCSSLLRCRRISPYRAFQTSIPQVKKELPDFALAIDIDGVLVRSSTPLPGAHEALRYLQEENVPFILLTNGGGKSEAERVADLSEKLRVKLDESMFMQSHTPFSEMDQYKRKDQTALVVGGDHDKCQQVAIQNYGYHNVVTAGDILCADPNIWPFSNVFLDYYKTFTKPLPKPLYTPGATLEDCLKIDAIFVYNDPRDWGLDSTIILDLLLSHAGYVGTLSPKNGKKDLPNCGYQQDSQPPLYYSNPDLWWAATYHLDRLGQGGFQHAFDGLWNTVTQGATLHKTIMGKPHQPTFEFAEKKLRAYRKGLVGQVGLNDPMRRVYMIGDNPESDIRGANGYQSPHGSQWKSILVKTGVYKDGTVPSTKPTVIVDDVQDAVRWAVEDAQK